ncbi:hypothetical protein GCM10007391_32380 [Alteromonas halophila]|uniref:Uncharacterized protein n=2 Tax=Alteromonas halophila TaxID=516698 RepID=A0A918JRH2_9ALTE|nr:hypothetical protein GCM10007391_32380 [Alteromonas halophila]
MKIQTATLKTLGLTFLLYIALTVTGSIILTGVWQSGIDASSMTHQELTHYAAQADMIRVGSALIGAFSAVICAAFATSRSAQASFRPAMYFAVMLIIYGVVSVVLHPEHSLLQQLSKLIAPIPLCLVGAWLARIVSSKRTSGQSSLNNPHTGA